MPPLAGFRYAEFEASSGGAGANATTATAFYSAIWRWQATGGSRFASNLIWDASNSTLVATGTSAQLVPTTNLQGQIDQMRAIRNTVNEFTALEPRAFSYVFFFWEGSAVIYGETIRNVILALIVVFFTTLVFLADIGGGAIVLLTISLVDVCILGFIHWWGMHMNTVIAVNLILAIGLTVDYSAHIAHAYMKARCAVELGRCVLPAAPVLLHAKYSCPGALWLMLSHMELTEGSRFYPQCTYPSRTPHPPTAALATSGPDARLSTSGTLSFKGG